MAKLPDKYGQMTDEEVFAAIRRAKATLGKDLVILGHHYQRDEVIQFADYRGDSLSLSRQAAAATEAKYIVFCGVYFMAETAAVLCQPGQIVIQPVPEALCPMAHLANAEEAGRAWAALAQVWGDDLMPITYQNSLAEVKAFVGERGGAVCTSSNATALFRWAFKHKNHILFLPDEHLGTNTAMDMGIAEDEIGIWDPVDLPDPQTLARCRVVVWKGFCYVHAGFTVDDVLAARSRYPEALIVVHPECPRPIVAAADATGSTTGIIAYIEQTPPGSTVVVGTEWHLVNRLAHEFTDRRVVPLSERACRTMGMTGARDLLYILDALLAGQPIHVVTVEEKIAVGARASLERMLEAS